MIEIDHNPHEKRPTNTIWWVAWGVVALLWIWYFAYREFDKDSLALGGVTGIIFALWAMEMKGDNSVPTWMIPRPRKRYLPNPTPGEPMFGANAKRLAIPLLVAIGLFAIWITI